MDFNLYVWLLYILSHLINDAFPVKSIHHCRPSAPKPFRSLPVPFLFHEAELDQASAKISTSHNNDHKLTSISCLRCGMHLLGQHFLGLLGHCLLGCLRHYAIACSMTLCPGVAGIVDDVGNFLFDASGELLLKLLGYDAVAYGVGSVGSFRHDDGSCLIC